MASKSGLTVSGSICRSCRQRLVPSFQRSFTTTNRKRAELDQTTGSITITSSSAVPSTPPPASSTPNIASVVSGGRSRPSRNSLSPSSPSSTNLFDDLLDGLSLNSESSAAHRLHIYSHKHNTHITLVQPPKPASQTLGSGVSSTTTKAAEQNKMVDVLLSVSTGNIGFKKSGRGKYDAAYQLMGFVLRQIQERGLLRDIKKLELALRGFGPGREATTKALLGTEGRFLRPKVTAVLDATRLKQGGTRGKKPRRLG